MQPSSDLSRLIENVYREESRAVFATLVRLLGDFDLAEDAMQDAFRVALETWTPDNIPRNPRSWLVSTARFKAIDRIRRQSRFGPLHTEELPKAIDDADPSDHLDDTIGDDILRLIFTCCHPALTQEARTAMTLREVCDLTTEEIASAFLITPSTLAQRIVRAKAKLREANIPFEVPPAYALHDRLAGVLQVIYLVFNEGYYASSGQSLTRVDLTGEAIRLGRLLYSLLPDPEVAGLLGLMLLHGSRQASRTTPNGDLILLEDQDRTLWDAEMIAEGLALVKTAFASKHVGPYALQAAIAALHAEAGSSETTDWPQIAGLYSLLQRINPSPVVELNRAVAISMYQGPEEGIQRIRAILERGELTDYLFAYAAMADLYQKSHAPDKARASWMRALELAQQEPERRFIEKKLQDLSS